MKNEKIKIAFFPYSGKKAPREGLPEKWIVL